MRLLVLDGFNLDVRLVGTKPILDGDLVQWTETKGD